jgi:hypothetical protein
MEPTSSFNLSAAARLSIDLEALLAALSAIAFSFGSWVFVGCTETIEVEGDHEGILVAMVCHEGLCDSCNMACNMVLRRCHVIVYAVIAVGNGSTIVLYCCCEIIANLPSPEEKRRPSAQYLMQVYTSHTGCRPPALNRFLWRRNADLTQKVIPCPSLIPRISPSGLLKASGSISRRPVPLPATIL